MSALWALHKVYGYDYPDPSSFLISSTLKGAKFELGCVSQPAAPMTVSLMRMFFSIWTLGFWMISFSGSCFLQDLGGCYARVICVNLAMRCVARMWSFVHGELRWLFVNQKPSLLVNDYFLYLFQESCAHVFVLSIICNCT